MLPKSGQRSQVTWLALSAADRQDAVDTSQLLAFWMQTTGAALLAVEWCSLARVRMAAQDSRSAHGLLYLAAGPEQEHGQGRIDMGSTSLTAPER